MQCWQEITENRILYLKMYKQNDFDVPKNDAISLRAMASNFFEEETIIILILS